MVSGLLDQCASEKIERGCRSAKRGCRVPCHAVTEAGMEPAWGHCRRVVRLPIPRTASTGTRARPCGRRHRVYGDNARRHGQATERRGSATLHRSLLSDDSESQPGRSETCCREHPVGIYRGCTAVKPQPRVTSISELYSVRCRSYHKAPRVCHT